MEHTNELDSDDDSMDATVTLRSPLSPLLRQQAASSNQAKVEREASDLGDLPVTLAENKREQLQAAINKHRDDTIRLLEASAANLMNRVSQQSKWPRQG